MMNGDINTMWNIKKIRKQHKSTATWLLMLTVLLVLSLAPLAAYAQGGKNVSSDQLMPVLGGALVEAGQNNWTEAAADVQEFHTLWDTVKTSSNDPAKAAQVDKALTEAEQALSSGEGEKAKTAISSLIKSVNDFVTETSDTNPAQAGTAAAQKLLPFARSSAVFMEKGDWIQARSDYDRIVKAWYQQETPIRTDNFAVYSELETKISLIRIAMQAEPVRAEQAIKEMKALTTLLSDYSEGKSTVSSKAPAGTSSPAKMDEAVSLLTSARQDVTNQDTAAAAAKLEQFIGLWPAIEGQVQISDPPSYNAIENEMTEATGYLLSSPPNTERAVQVIDSMLNRLQPLTEARTYTAWDAALILLREGLEAILVLAALLAYAKKSGEAAAGRWIWAGAGTGLVLSGALTILLTTLIAAAASGSVREMLEGITGLVAVVLMLTVGSWLHSKSNTAAWNRYVENSVGSALAKGSLWSLFAVSGLAILREGAETAIFYIGMAPSIQPSQLLLGIAGATVVLVILAVAIIRFSVRLPIRAFFLTATVLIYYLVFRFLGESIHSLQVAGKLPGHTLTSLPSISWLGMYPTWETFVPQIAVLIFMIWQLVRQEMRNAKQRNTVEG